MIFEKLSQKFPENTFLRLLANKKIRQVIALLFWIAFILIVIFVIIKPNLNNVQEPKNEKKEIVKSYYDSYKNILISKNYDYKYDINKEGIHTIYEGKMENDIQTGYVESSLGINKYYFDQTGFYNVLGEEKTLVEKEEIFDTYLNIDYLISIMDQYDEQEGIITFQKEGLYGKMYLVDDTLKLEISENENNYLLEFYNFDK